MGVCEVECEGEHECNCECEVECEGEYECNCQYERGMSMR